MVTLCFCELVGGLEASGVVAVIGPKGYPEKLPVRVDLELFERPTLPVILPIHIFVVGELNEVRVTLAVTSESKITVL